MTTTKSNDLVQEILAAAEGKDPSSWEFILPATMEEADLCALGQALGPHSIGVHRIRRQEHEGPDVWVSVACFHLSYSMEKRKKFNGDPPYFISYSPKEEAYTSEDRHTSRVADGLG